MDDLLRLTLEPKLSSELARDFRQTLAVATVVNTRGSAYRRPGARMVLEHSPGMSAGITARGAVSAGCLERDIIAHCDTFANAAGETPLLLTYDGSSADELVFGLKLGCDGIVQVLVEPAGPNSAYQSRFARLLPLLQSTLASQKRAVVVTIFDVFDMEGSDDIGINPASVVGSCLLETGKETFELTAMPAPLSQYLRNQAKLLLKGQNPQSLALQENVEGWLVSALIEVVESIPSILVLGGGQDVQPLVEMTKILGWNAVVSDGKWATKSGSFAGEAAGSFDAAIIMTHDYELDRSILAELIKRDIGYLGIVGPRRRADKLLAELALAGEPITDEKMARLHSPVGLDIGAERPEEIALSILAEIKAVLAGHKGGKLREKQGPIHEPTSSVEPAIHQNTDDHSAAAALVYKPLVNTCAIDASAIDADSSILPARKLAR